jgi:hypothetical protein
LFGTATGAVVVTGTTFTNNQTSGFLTAFADTSSWTAVHQQLRVQRKQHWR